MFFSSPRTHRSSLIAQHFLLEDEMIQDLRYGIRMLLSNKSFTLVAMLTLALGIGANTALFSVVDALALRPLPYAEPERLFWVEEVSKTHPANPVFGAHYLNWQEQSQTLAATRRDYEASSQSLLFRIKDDQLMAETSNQLIKLYSQTVIPQSSLALEASLSSYETGAVDFLTVLMNYVTVVEYEMNYEEELQNYYLAVSRLEEMTGRSLLP